MQAEHIHLAHDGSLNADAVARYAMRFAARTPSRTLHLVHVREAAGGMTDVPSRLERLDETCRLFGVALEVTEVGAGRRVDEALAAALPRGPRDFVLAGLRAHASRRGILAGTVTESLLRDHRLNVLAIRVLSPGLLGLPHRLLYPMAGVPRSWRGAIPFLAVLAPDLEEIALMTVATVSSLAYARLTAARAEGLVGTARAYLAERARELGAALPPPVPRLETYAVVSDDWPKEIVLHAARMKSQLIFMGATERTLPRQLFFGNPLEQVLRAAPCDVAIFRQARGG